MKIIKKFSFLVVVLLMLFMLNVPSTKAVGETFDDISGVFPKVTVTADNRYQMLKFDNVEGLLTSKDEQDSFFTGTIEIFFDNTTIHWNKQVLNFVYSKDKGFDFYYDEKNSLSEGFYNFYDLKNPQLFTYYDVATNYPEDFEDHEGAILFDFSVALDVAKNVYKSNQIYVAVRGINEGRLTDFPVYFNSIGSSMIFNYCYTISYYEQSNSNLLLHKDLYFGMDGDLITVYEPIYYSKQIVSRIWDRYIYIDNDPVTDSDACYYSTKPKAISDFEEISKGHQTFIINDSNTFYEFAYNTSEYSSGESYTFKLYFDEYNLDYHFDFFIQISEDSLYIDTGGKNNDEFLYDYLTEYYNLSEFDIQMLCNLSSYRSGHQGAIDFTVILENAKRLLGVEELYLLCDFDGSNDYKFYFARENIHLTNYCYVEYNFETFEEEIILYDKKLFISNMENFFTVSDVSLPGYEVLAYYSGPKGIGKRYYPLETPLTQNTSVYADTLSDYVVLNYNTGCDIELDPLIMNRTGADNCLPGIERDGYVFVGWSLVPNDSSSIIHEQYFFEYIITTDNLTTEQFMVYAIWSKELKLSINKNNSVIRLKFPSYDEIDSQTFTFKFQYDNNLDNYITYVLFADGNDSIILEIDEMGGNDVLLNINLIDYEVVKLSNGWVYIYFDFSRQIEAINSGLKEFNKVYSVEADFKYIFSDKEFAEGYGFEITDYRNLKTYNIPTYDSVKKEVYYVPVHYNLGSEIDFEDGAGRIIKSMYYYKNGRKIEVNPGDKLDGNHQIYVDVSYLVTFVNNNNTANTELFVLLDSPAKEPSKPTKVGSTFVGWYSDEALSKKFDFSKQIYADTTIYAKWEPKMNTITFNSVGGTFVEDMKAQVYSEIKAPTAPTKHGYIFDGWYLTAQYTQEYFFTFMPDENLSLVAKWKPIEVTVAFDSNDEHGYTYEQIFTFGTNQELASNMFVREGYTFVGWNSKADGTGTSYTPKQVLQISANSLHVIEDETDPDILYAMWEVGTFNNPSNPSDNPSIGDNLNESVTWSVLLSVIGLLSVLAFFLKRKR